MKEFSFNRLPASINEQFGLTKERTGLVFNKLYKIAKLLPKYTYIAEALLNDPTFTEEEKVFGVFVLGKVEGMVSVMKAAKIRTAIIGAPLFVELVRIFATKRQPKDLPELPTKGTVKENIN